MEGNDWSYVSYNGQYGYVMTRYLSTTQPSGETDESQSSSGGGSQSSGSAGDDGLVENGGVILDVTLEAPSSATFALAAPQGEDALKLWSMCAQTGEPLELVPAGQQVEIILIGRSWCLVQYGTVQGYCRTDSLEVTP